MKKNGSENPAASQERLDEGKKYKNDNISPLSGWHGIASRGHVFTLTRHGLTYGDAMPPKKTDSSLNVDLLFHKLRPSMKMTMI